MRNLTRYEQSFLLYLETRLVDHEGFVNQKQINEEEIEWGNAWTAEGFVEFRRLPCKDVRRDTNSRGNLTHTVRFSEEAWALAHKLRRERAERHVPIDESIRAFDAMLVLTFQDKHGGR